MLTAPLAGWVLQRMWQTPVPLRAAGFTVFGLAAAIALPTIAIDLYNTQDVTNRRPAAGFPWTVVLSVSAHVSRWPCERLPGGAGRSTSASEASIVPYAKIAQEFFSAIQADLEVR